MGISRNKPNLCTCKKNLLSKQNVTFRNIAQCVNTVASFTRCICVSLTFIVEISIEVILNQSHATADLVLNFNKAHSVKIIPEEWRIIAVPLFYYHNKQNQVLLLIQTHVFVYCLHCRSSPSPKAIGALKRMEKEPLRFQSLRGEVWKWAGRGSEPNRPNAIITPTGREAGRNERR